MDVWIQFFSNVACISDENGYKFVWGNVTFLGISLVVV